MQDLRKINKGMDMGDQIVTVADIRAKARRAFEAGLDLSDNPFPWHSAAYVTWQDEWVRLAGARAQLPHVGIVKGAASAVLDIDQAG